MIKKSFVNEKTYHYLIFIFILLLAILAFYLSCRSKSPTEPDSRLNNQVSAQSTNNTTTSTSTTTSVKPGQSPTNTTTLITSRNLTTTSTRTTTTSTSIPSTTTSRKPTTSTTSTISTTTSSIPSCDLQWCYIHVHFDTFTVEMSNGDKLTIPADQTLWIDLIMKNNGSDSINVDDIEFRASFPPPSFSFNPGSIPTTLFLPTGGICTTTANIYQVVISSSASPGDSCPIEIDYSGKGPSGYSCDSSTFYMTIEVQ